MPKRKYEPGMVIGPLNTLFLEDLGYEQVGLKKRKVRKGIFKCSFCGNEFKSSITSVVSGHTKSCGCISHPVKPGMKFGSLTVKYRIPHKRDCSNNYIWHCECDCGNEVDVSTDTLRDKNKPCTCGCSRRRQDMIGRRFGKLTVIKPAMEFRNCTNNYKIGRWECLCDCGQISYVTTSHLLSGHTQSCGCWKESRGEILIATLLEELGISFKREFIFDNCQNPKTNHVLRFDFYLPDYNCCIEYDGIQHYKITGWSSEKVLKATQERDKIKTSYCMENNIKLIRIPYWEKDNITKEYLRERIFDGEC